MTNKIQGIKDWDCKCNPKVVKPKNAFSYTT